MVFSPPFSFHVACVPWNNFVSSSTNWGSPSVNPAAWPAAESWSKCPRRQVESRVPPRTFAWLERFWECSQCRKVFWHGTHWKQIAEALRLTTAMKGEGGQTAPQALTDRAVQRFGK